jgi:hypothetical protein
MLYDMVLVVISIGVVDNIKDKTKNMIGYLNWFDLKNDSGIRFTLILWRNIWKGSDRVFKLRH